MSDKIFYKKRLIADEAGLVVVTDKLVSIHETPCFYFCVPEHGKQLLSILKSPGESELSSARRRKMLKKIDKRGSRIAFETEEEAMTHLRFLKRRQLGHMKRESEFIEKFLSTDETNKEHGQIVVPDSKELVHEYLVFE